MRRQAKATCILTTGKKGLQETKAESNDDMLTDQRLGVEVDDVRVGVVGVRPQSLHHERRR